MYKQHYIFYLNIIDSIKSYIAVSIVTSINNNTGNGVSPIFIIYKQDIFDYILF